MSEIPISRFPVADALALPEDLRERKLDVQGQQQKNHNSKCRRDAQSNFAVEDAPPCTKEGGFSVCPVHGQRNHEHKTEHRHDPQRPG